MVNWLLYKQRLDILDGPPMLLCLLHASCTYINTFWVISWLLYNQMLNLYGPNILLCQLHASLAWWCSLSRGWPLIIWGGHGANKEKLLEATLTKKIWSEAFRKKNQHRSRKKNRRPLINFFLNFFSSARPFEIYFFFQEGLLKFFFPGEGPSKFFFSRFSPPPPRSLRGVIFKTRAK